MNNENQWVAMVREFHTKFGQPIGTEGPKFTPRTILRMDLIAEECHETTSAIFWYDMIETADGIVDTIYVLIGAALEFGIDIDEIFAEVHRTNMLKEGGPTRADGKILKPEGWQPPKIAELIAKQRNKANGK